MELQKYISRFLTRKRKFSDKDLAFRNEISKIIGYEIQDIEIYNEAFSLKTSDRRNNKNYERLEFLGDSVLGSIISCHLFAMYPDGNEGFLTQMKSKIVNRKNLNKLGDEMQLAQLIRSNNTNQSCNLSGNLFEAFIGAIYLDFGYEICKKVVLEKIFTSDQINRLENKIVSYKSILLEWSQKKKVDIKYQTEEEIHPNKNQLFRSYIWINDEKISNATETSKKKAEEKAAQRAFYILNKKESIAETFKINA